jgi:NAD-dependent DNA ligase
VKRERVFPKEAAGVVEGAVSSASTSDGAAWAARSLTGMKFVLAGKLSKSKADMTKMVTDLGGKVVTKVDKKVAAVISTPGGWIESYFGSGTWFS